jgi:DNA polymerase type B, organellar and viral
MLISDLEIKDTDQIIFTYKILPKDSNINTVSINYPLYNKAVNEIDTKNRKTFKNFGFSLPTNMNIWTWGDIIFNKDNIFVIKKYKSDGIYYIELLNDHMVVELKINDRLILKFKDYPNLNCECPLNNFTRYIKSYTQYFENSKLVLYTILKQTKFIKTKKIDKVMCNTIITMDIETQAIDGYMWPYCISIYDGKIFKSFYLLDYNNNIENLVLESIKYLMFEKYSGYKVYIHNFSYFDSIFLLKSLHKLADNINPIMRDGRFIDCKFRFNKKYILYFRDSMLLLPTSLKKLSENFKCENKGIFPYNFVNNKYNSNIKLDYIGKIPRLKFFDLKNISSENFKNYILTFKNNVWNLKHETIKYSELDVKILYDVLIKFNQIIFNKFKIDAFKHPTISSLAFAIYRTNYLNKFKIPIINDKIYDDIKPSYTGGACDVYKPFSFFSKIFAYDVNSLYPSVMQFNELPVGEPTYFEGDITKIENNPFGFFEVEVTAPDNLYVPLLQTRLKTEDGIKTVAPVGTWINTYFSKELIEAAKLGYKYKILRGYLFDKDFIFEDFIYDLYYFKENSNKDSADYIIYKLLMNSLYGRFGMSPIMDKHLILDSDTAKEKYYKDDKLVITNIINLTDNKELISFHFLKDYNKNVNISIPIASAITAYARIYMSKFKNKYQDNLFYTDTDSIYLNIKLDPSFISNKILGFFKLEKIFESAIFLAPKMYGGKYLYKFGKLTQFMKIKGVKININFIKLFPLLFKDKHVNIIQEKWFRDINNSTIKIENNIPHNLKLTSFKRNIIYKNNKFVNTKPLKLENSKIVDY